MPLPVLVYKTSAGAEVWQDWPLAIIIIRIGVATDIVDGTNKYVPVVIVVGNSQDAGKRESGADP